MSAFNNYPWTNFHDLNLDAFFQAFKKLQDEWDSFGYTITATAHAGAAPNVAVTGDLINGLNFDFTLVAGDEGPEGPAGNGIASVSFNNYQLTFTFTDGTTYTTPSIRGDTGAGLEILDVYATLADLQAAHPTGNAGEMYEVGTAPNFTLYLWSPSDNAWKDGGAISSPQPSATTPLMDGTASLGSEYTYARGDHKHPTDTSRASQTDLTAIDNRLQTAEGTISQHTTDISNLAGDVTDLNNDKQNVLVSGTNIKSVNSNSLLGSGDLALLTLLGATMVHDSATTSSTTTVAKNYTVSGDGIVIATTSNRSDNTNAAGNCITNVQLNSVTMARNMALMQTASSASLSAVSTVAMIVHNNDVITMNNQNSKSGSKDLDYILVCIGCTVA